MPADQQAHVFGLSSGLGQVGMTVGPLLVGAAVDILPLTAVLLAVMIIGMLAAVNLALTPGLARRPPDRL
ncbi:hypothetical protein [Microlunatus soli]|uniref:hypothetical protein n=1 Tax=Microlunatus soli TaxID=630515 RepID=UPI000B8324FC|nr:hypothetical protein [Microlunatus soli]